MEKFYSTEDLTKGLSLYYLNSFLKKCPIEKYHKVIDASCLHEREKYRKKSEILMLNSFMHHFPTMIFENLTGECPDFIAQYEGKRIGIELTEVINHLELKRLENNLNKIFRYVEKIIEEENTTKYRGVYFLEFYPEYNFESLDNQDFNIDSIYKSIISYKPRGCVRKIRRLPHRRRVFIAHDYTVGLFDELCSGKIIESILKKNEKFPYYDSSVDECWLVMVSDMNSLSSRYSFIKDKDQLRSVPSPFHKIFHLENLYGEITRIK